MQKNAKKIIGRLAERLFNVSPEDYLVSENFSRFCNEDDLEDIWQESLELSRDTPDLYGDAVIKSAVVLFLHHTFHRRPDEFPGILLRFLTGFSLEISQPLPLDGLEKDLTDLGYSKKDLGTTFSALEAMEEDRQKWRTTGCPG